MEFSKSIIDIISARHSTRAFDKNNPPAPEVFAALNTAAGSLNKGLWGEEVSFTIAETDPGIDRYNCLSNPPAFLVGKIKQGPNCHESYGYRFEQLILKATDLGLDTCWMGYFSDEIPAEKLVLKSGEIIPGISPLGYKQERGLNRDKIMECLNYSRRRPFTDLFFADTLQTPLSDLKAGKYKQILEMVRRAPSAGNLQPWRVVMAEKSFHFFQDTSRSNHGYDERRLQNIDMGIAMCHFELTAQELGIKGSWKRLEKSSLPVAGKLNYAVTFVEA